MQYEEMPTDRRAFALAAITLVLGASGAFAQGETGSGTQCLGAVSETIYVPAFSRIQTSELATQPLASTLVVHNTDPSVSISITAIEFYDSSGELIAALLDAPISLPPFASTHKLSSITDNRGGIGANFMLTWVSNQPACSPHALAVMIGGEGTQGISFTIDGRVIAREVASPE